VNETQIELGYDYHGEDPSGCFVSEKFDGCRAYWDGKQLWTRSGRIIKAPASLTANLPAAHLDCELWAGYGKFAVASVAVRLGRFTADCRLIVHDCPQAPGDWSERIATAPEGMAVAWSVCKGRADMLTKLAEVMARGGEGLVLRRPGIRYLPGWRSAYAKVKPESVTMRGGRK
jgi:DNA ligase-1